MGDTCKPNCKKETKHFKPFHVKLGQVAADGGIVKPVHAGPCTDAQTADINHPCYTQYENEDKNGNLVVPLSDAGKSIPKNLQIQKQGSDLKVTADCYEDAIFNRVVVKQQWQFVGSCEPECDGALDARKAADAGCSLVGGVNGAGYSDCQRMADGKVTKEACSDEFKDKYSLSSHAVKDCENLVSWCSGKDKDRPGQFCNVMDVFMGYKSMPHAPLCRLWQCSKLSADSIPPQDGDLAYLMAWSNKPIPVANATLVV